MCSNSTILTLVIHVGIIVDCFIGYVQCQKKKNDHAQRNISF